MDLTIFRVGRMFGSGNAGLDTQGEKQGPPKTKPGPGTDTFKRSVLQVTTSAGSAEIRLRRVDRVNKGGRGGSVALGESSAFAHAV
jgi:hypothetical protein